jgi:DNA-binding NarL/FixJ family response regulator
MATRILIVDDHPATREGLAMRIACQKDMEVCGEADGMVNALKLLNSTSPDVVVVDVQLKKADGLDLVKRIKARDGAARILVWSVYPDKLYAKRALNAGALGYINKAYSTSQIVEAIRRVREGKVYVSEEMAELLLHHAVGGAESVRQSPIETLSDRELEVFRLIGQGLSPAQLAAELHISRHTIDTHKQRIKEKLGLATASELTQAAVRWVIEDKCDERNETISP